MHAFVTYFLPGFSYFSVSTESEFLWDRLPFSCRYYWSWDELASHVVIIIHISPYVGGSRAIVAHLPTRRFRPQRANCQRGASRGNSSVHFRRFGCCCIQKGSSAYTQREKTRRDGFIALAQQETTNQAWIVKLALGYSHSGDGIFRKGKVAGTFSAKSNERSRQDKTRQRQDSTRHHTTRQHKTTQDNTR
jgi:hypothetical protein